MNTYEFEIVQIVEETRTVRVKARSMEEARERISMGEWDEDDGVDDAELHAHNDNTIMSEREVTPTASEALIARIETEIDELCHLDVNDNLYTPLLTKWIGEGLVDIFIDELVYLDQSLDILNRILTDVQEAIAVARTFDINE